MSRPANPGTRAVLNARARKREIAAERAQLGDKVSALDAEEQEIDTFLAQCEHYANETPAPESPPDDGAGMAGQGTGPRPHSGQGGGATGAAPAADPCSAEDTDSEGRRGSGAEPLARAGGGRESALPDDPASQTAHPPHPGNGPECRIVVSDSVGGTTVQRPDCGGSLEHDETYPDPPGFLRRPQPNEAAE